MERETLVYEERQTMRYWWLHGVPATAAFILTVSLLWQAVAAGSRPIPELVVLAVLLWAFAALFRFMRIRICVTGDRTIVSMPPFYRKTIRKRDIRSMTQIDIDPFWQFGGWGVKVMPTVGTYVGFRVNRAVKLELTNGKTLCLGSQDAGTLYASMNAMAE